MIPGKSGATAIKRLAALQDELGQLNDLASAGTLLMVCAGRDTQLREAVTLVGGWQRNVTQTQRGRHIRSLNFPSLPECGQCRAQ
ncbi:MAG: CHAD domain-containing protein [Dehalococcoidia bacterium]|nr:CHAD domain-containing protein [Dehalococcoidia bacterium]